MTAAERAGRTRETDALCARVYAATGCPPHRVALVAVGSQARGELAPHSDLDLVLVHDEAVGVGGWAAELWYPLWDSGWAVDHAVRSVPEVLEQGSGDLRVATGMLDVRHVAGDPALTVRLRSAVLAQWRRDARLRLEELRALVEERHQRAGELAHAAVPDLKEAAGGLRDVTTLRGLVASWLVEVPHHELERCRDGLLDVRDALHGVAGRPTDRVLPEYWEPMADLLGLADAAAVQRRTRGLARRLAHLSRLTWARAEAVRRRPVPGPRRPRLDAVAPGVAVSHREVVLDGRASVERDPVLLLRAAAEAAERGLVLAPSTAAALARRAPELPDPWPAEARALLVRLLGAGAGLRAVWETLEETDAVTRVLPEWESVRLLPHVSPVHRYTVDRHLLETCCEAARLVERVTRPDVLLVAALLHDLGKGLPGDHSVAGAPVARAVAARMGFDAASADLVGRLVRWHLLLPEVATGRDVDDPDSALLVARRVGDPETLRLLAALTEADARATSATAWTGWRAGLVDRLVRRTAAALGADAPPGGLDEVQSEAAATLGDWP